MLLTQEEMIQTWIEWKKLDEPKESLAEYTNRAQVRKVIKRLDAPCGNELHLEQYESMHKCPTCWKATLRGLGLTPFWGQ